MRRTILLGCLIMLASLAGAQTATHPDSKPAAATSSANDLPTSETIDSFLKHYFGYDANIQWQIVSIHPSPAQHVAEVVVEMKTQEGQSLLHLFVLPDQNWAISGDMMRFGADPFAFNNRQFAERAHGPARGPADAKITLVEFSDLECPACKNAQPIIDRLQSDFPDARFIFQNFPLEQIHPWAFKAAEYGDCVARNNTDAFWKFLTLAYDNQDRRRMTSLRCFRKNTSMSAASASAACG